jgi:hypothetical protein
MCGWLVFCRCLFYEFELVVLFFDKKTTILSHTYEGIAIFVDNWKNTSYQFTGRPW